MFNPSQIHHGSCHHKCQHRIPDNFTLLCWNVHKNNKASTFKKYIEDRSRHYKIDLIVFQEMRFKKDEPFILSDFSYAAAANMEFRNSFFGVMTASKTFMRDTKAYLSEGKELFFGPRKSLLFSSYLFEDESMLLVVNVHAINFRGNSWHNRELERFFKFVKNYKGALLVAGDFNTWNRKRSDTLFKKAKKLNLKAVTFKNMHLLKSFMGNHLDFIFYKGLKLEDAFLEKADGYSDHNPLFARFRKL